MKRILIVDDYEVLREGVKRIFDKQAGAVSFGEASSGPEALRLAREEDWEIVVLDLSLGGRNGLEVLKELKQIRPRLPLLILSMHTEVQFARRAFKAGASGYITKYSPRSELGRDTDRPPHETLSDREFEVMRLIASGKTAGEIDRPTFRSQGESGDHDRIKQASKTIPAGNRNCPNAD
jgi:two-component system invasion response regulator UvrY